MACNKCKKKICLCSKKVISRLGLAGKSNKPGPPGPQGPPGPATQFEQVIGQSAFWGTLSGAIGQSPTGTTFPNLNNNFFVLLPKFFSISIGLTVTAGAQHTVKAYFLKNAVQVGLTYEKTMFAKDYLHFQTDLIQFSSGDFLSLYIESTAADCVIQPGHLINYRII